MTSEAPFTHAELQLIADALSTHVDKLRQLQRRPFDVHANERIQEVTALKSKVLTLKERAP